MIVFWFRNESCFSLPSWSDFAKNNFAHIKLVYTRFKVKGTQITGLNSFLNVESSTHRLHNSLCVGVKWVSSKKKPFIPPVPLFITFTSCVAPFYVNVSQGSSFPVFCSHFWPFAHFNICTSATYTVPTILSANRSVHTVIPSILIYDTNITRAIVFIHGLIALLISIMFSFKT